MSTKPLDAGRFAVDGVDVNAVNISAPSSGLRDTGFPNNYVPPAGEFNYLENIAYRWRQWLNDGNVSFTTLSLASTLAVTGVATFSSNATVGGTLGVTGVTTLSSTLGVTSNATVGGTLGVTSNATVGGTLGVTSNTTVGGTFGVTGTSTLSNTVTVAVNKNIVLSGTGKVEHGTITRILPILGPQIIALSGAALTLSVGANPLIIPIGALTVGNRITTVSANIADAIGGASTARIRMFVHSFTFPAALVANGTASSGAGTNQTISVAFTQSVSGTDAEYFAVVERVSGAGTIDVYAAAMTLDNPP